jgi:hypothetical protein
VDAAEKRLTAIPNNATLPQAQAALKELGGTLRKFSIAMQHETWPNSVQPAVNKMASDVAKLLVVLGVMERATTASELEGDLQAFTQAATPANDDIETVREKLG